MRLTHLLAGQARPIAAKSGLSGIFKTPCDGPVTIGAEGLAGDTIVDRDNHGGLEQAVYLIGQPDLDWWAQELARPLPPGTFGENMVIGGLQTGPLGLGDIVQVGAATLQITAPRIPCVTLSARMGDPGFARRFLAAGRPGAYARVRVPGIVQAGDAVSLSPAAGTRVTLTEVMDGLRQNWPDAELLRRISATEAHAKLRAMAQERTAR
ncbi:MOSC domain-containing protein [Limimaricola sp.]|uniref:MOSC domain-containing protein n=1 Tax=Limimaricola sp. TaxID=2211665 RepID=UPI0025B9CD8D|nr:MOSC domain-containing protein [Limimaricola sp.]